TFQQYCFIIADSTAKIPDNMITFDQAASVQVGIIPFVVALYAQQPELAHLAPWLCACKLNLVPCLIFTMFISIQLVKLFELSPIITTASFHNTGFLSSRSATRVLDRNLSTTALKNAIAKVTSTLITLAFGAISLPDTLNRS
ncbi:uncharacterized protein F5147DRAFT_573967, partial [Suillus discolor]